MNHELKNTLRWHMTRPLVTKGEVLDAHMSDVVGFAEAGQGSLGKVLPETDAITFYMLNHAMGELRQQVGADTPLNEEQQQLADTYFSELAIPTVRLYWYLLAICTRESRHARTSGDSLYQKMAKEFSPATVTFHKTVRGSSSSSAVAKLYAAPPQTTLEEYAGKFLPWIFYKAGYSGGYGGKKWGAIADCIAAFVNGDYSAEMMMDVGWTLCHNNGPIFNKGIFYEMYSGYLVRLLDVQRAGMIPAYVDEVGKGAGYFAPGFVTTRHKELLAMCKNTLGDHFGGFVDWSAVTKDAVHGNYGSHVGHQAQHFATHPAFANSDALVAAKEAADAAQVKQAAVDSKWYVIGGEKHAKVKINRSAA